MRAPPSGSDDTLRKWSSTDVNFCAIIPEHLIEMEDIQLRDPDNSLKTLDIHWSIIKDAFRVSTPNAIPAYVTKRTVTFVVEKVFDILGLFSPITILAKYSGISTSPGTSSYRKTS